MATPVVTVKTYTYELHHELYYQQLHCIAESGLLNEKQNPWVYWIFFGVCIMSGSSCKTFYFLHAFLCTYFSLWISMMADSSFFLTKSSLGWRWMVSVTAAASAAASSAAARTSPDCNRLLSAGADAKLPMLLLLLLLMLLMLLMLLLMMMLYV